jgi:GntR family transcriptional regulator, vanillate catabolism transcriptional regulator
MNAVATTMKRDTETERLFERLKMMILDGELPTGTPLNQSQLCRDLQSSRTPVREAIRKLEGIGLVTTIPHRGSYVAQVDLREYLQIVEIRLLLEPFATQRAAGRVPVATLEALEQRLHELNRSAPTHEDFLALHQIDNDIHRAIGIAAGNPRLDELMNTLRSLCQGFSHDARLRFHVMIDEHFALLRALRDGNADDASEIMHHHIQGFGEALPHLMHHP